LVVIDTAADTFGGNEIARPQVRQFLSRLTRLAQQIDGVVIVLAHPSQSGMSSGSGGGGSTAWSNSARSRLYLEIPEPESGRTVERNARILTRKKSNYASIGDEITLKYVDGCFEAEGENSNNDMVSRIEKVSREVTCEEIFLSALDRLTS
ncbi:MAG: AAA family ATPase, partial [Alphaproteobacteria bacterium]|nr:AAA family ATPase [Alphaproteobacteria bacterium]